LTSRTPAIARWGSVVLLVALWEAVGQIGWIHPLFFSYPSKIVSGIYGVILSGELTKNVLVSAYEFGFGFSLALLTAIPLGLGMGRSRMLEYVFDPYISFFQAMPRVAILPLLILMFGVGYASKIVLVYIGSFFPLVINTWMGAKGVDKSLIEAGKSFGYNDRTLFYKVVLPSTLSYIIAGIRIGLATGLIMVVVGEFWASTAGLGYMISLAAGHYDTPVLLGGVLILATIGLIMTEALKRLEIHLAPWRFTETRSYGHIFSKTSAGR
jgi:ABC-type nitrate/sulfonate/bicarbonate transport system permease component